MSDCLLADQSLARGWCLSQADLTLIAFTGSKEKNNNEYTPLPQDDLDIPLAIKFPPKIGNFQNF